MFWAWISGITAAILLLFLAPVRLEVVYCYRDGEDFLGLTISIPGGWGSWEVNFTPRRHKLLAPDIADWGNFFSGDKEATQPLERLAGHTARRKSSGQREGKAGGLARFIISGTAGYWWYKLKSVAGIWQHFFARITCKRCRLFFALGAKDPAAAALLYGSTWSLLAWMYQNLRRRTRLDFNNLEWRVAPHFDIPGWQVDFNCIFTFRAGHIISAGMQSLVLLLQTVWQLRRSGPVARTPHRSFDEDRHGKHQGYG